MSSIITQTTGAIELMHKMRPAYLKGVQDTLETNVPVFAAIKELGMLNPFAGKGNGVYVTFRNTSHLEGDLTLNAEPNLDGGLSSLSQTSKYSYMSGFSPFAFNHVDIVIDMKALDAAKDPAEFIRDKMKASMNDLATNIGRQINTSVSVTNGMLSLGDLFPDDPTTGTLHGIARSTNPSLQHQVVDIAADFDGTVDETNIRHVLIAMESKAIAIRGKSPKLYILGSRLYNAYRTATLANERTSENSKNSGAHLPFANGRVVVDPNLADDYGFAICDGAMEWMYMDGKWMVNRDSQPVTLVDKYAIQDVTLAYITPVVRFPKEIVKLIPGS